MKISRMGIIKTLLITATVVGVLGMVAKAIASTYAGTYTGLIFDSIGLNFLGGGVLLTMVATLIVCDKVVLKEPVKNE